MKLNNYEESDIEIVSEYFNLNQESLKAEIRLLYQKAVEEKIFKFGINIRIWLQWFLKNSHNESVYENFFKLIKNFSVIPVTSCTCERCFSKLQIVLSKLRNSMTQDRLFNLMMPFIEQDICAQLDIQDIIDEFKTMVPFERRMTL